MEFTYADVFEAVARAQPDRPALLQGERRVDWAEFDARADALARALLDAGLARGAKIAAYLHNRPEYLETYYAAFKAGLVPFNVNYRYGVEELVHLLGDADAEAVVFESGFAGTLDEVRRRLPHVKVLLCVEEAGHPAPEWAQAYEAAAGRVPAVRPTRAAWGRSGDDLLLLYTGGTTGLPKGVMWRQDELFRGLGQGGVALTGVPPVEALEEIGPRLADPSWERPVLLAASPLMHGTAQFGALIVLGLGGAVALLPSRRFNAEELWTEAERHGATRIGIVGQPFAGPMLQALEANPGRWRLDRVGQIGSSGAMWSQENKQALLRRLPGCLLTDAFSSSEALGMGASVSAAGAEAGTARFVLGPNSAVFTEDGRRARPGERGLAAVGGRLPDGYYKDPEKTAKTFPILEGRRWCVPGDWAQVEADGSVTLLGRGSVCINTGGEKVFPEEVEEALKRWPGVRDALVVGAPDPRFGETICGVLELEAGASAPGLAEISAFVRLSLADYKAPRALVVLDSLGRAPNGKADYKAVRARALEALAADAERR